MTDNEILNNILNLMKIKGVRQADLARYLGISRNAVTQWKTGVSKSYMDYLDQLASYFDVTKEQLIHANQDTLYKTQLSLNDQEMLKNFHTLPQSVQHSISQLITDLSHQHL